MSSPVDTPVNPFRDPFQISESPDHTPNHQESLHEANGMGSSAETSRPGSAGGKRREKKKVVFTGGVDPAERSSRNSWLAEHPGLDGSVLSPPRITQALESTEASGSSTPTHSRQGSADLMLPDAQSSSKSHLPELSRQQTQELHQAFSDVLDVPRPRPAIRQAPSDHRGSLVDANVDPPDDYDGLLAHRKLRAQDAHERAKKLETEQSQPNSRYNSPEREQRAGRSKVRSQDIPLEDLGHRIDIAESESDDDLEMPKRKKTIKPSTAEAFALVRKHTMGRGVPMSDTPPSPGTHSDAVTPVEEEGDFEFYRPHPKEYRGGVLGSLMKLYEHGRHPHSRSSSAQPLHRRGLSNDLSVATSPTTSPPESGASTPGGSNWFTRKHREHSSSALSKLIGSSASLGSPLVSGLGEQVTQRLKEQAEHEKAHRPGLGRRARSGNALAALNRMSRPRDEEIRITVHIEQYLVRQKYLLKLCRALMLYGAPTHRLEEYMNMSARVLEIQAQFLYIPGSMIMSFDDPETHTTEVKLVRVTQGLDLGKLRDVHEVYKEVVHDRIGVDEATSRLNAVLIKPDKHSKWLRIPVYGLAAASVGPFAFGARLIDLPIAFILGCILGLLQLVVAPRSDLYANVFEIAATVITSFLARAFGSIRYPNSNETIFCFSALAQSSIALILPGYVVLCASLELQSRSIVAGSIRMVYAIIYSLFLGFGITIGTAVYGIMDKNATSATTCDGGIPAPYFFPFVPAFAMTLIIINQAKWKQAPIMLIIAFLGYIVSHYSSARFAGNTQVSSTLGAFAIGCMANTYSRLGSKVENKLLDIWEDTLRHHWKAAKTRLRLRRLLGRTTTTTKPGNALEEGAAHEVESLYVRQTRRVGYGLAAAAMLPAIFVQVPSGLAVSGSLVSGLASANQIAGNATNGTTVVNSTTLTVSAEGLNSIAFNVSYSVVQVAIGITVGLFLSAVVVYPMGKRRSGLFSF
ncbi:hypothetical protein LTR91_005119 [Friedmanniomyces endolithicus]|uniref:Threonine/serine exporter-like N-terminal domain-containing protein n=1 Tax=Friedmanniomyces endolithicus TaxID=329885 RepID=A0AAN6QXW5_9PEZI|nr:hypothetical protein LTR91_005119 [Friedmanniomyces endolithicus]